jgi:hypothetical protein
VDSKATSGRANDVTAHLGVRACGAATVVDSSAAWERWADGLFRWLACALVALMGVACSSHSSNAADVEADAGAIPECLEYQRALERCSGRPSSVSNDAVTRLQSGADRSRLRDLCAQNLQRINATCR